MSLKWVSLSAKKFARYFYFFQFVLGQNESFFFTRNANSDKNLFSHMIPCTLTIYSFIQFYSTYLICLEFLISFK